MTVKVMIAGAGLGGLTLANGLARAGVDVAVYEREAAADSRAQGARFHMDDRGVRALRECLSSNAFEMFSATMGEPSESICVLGETDDAALAVVGRRPFTGGEGRPDRVRPGRPVSRGLLRRILLADVADRVRFGSELVRYEPLDGGVRAHFADGTAAEADVLVGADGIGSAVRRQYLPHLDVVDTGVRWLGGRTPLTGDILATGLPELIRGSFTITSIGELGMIVAAMRFAEPPGQAAARLMPGLAVDEEDYLMWALTPGPEQLGEVAEIGTRTGSDLWRLAASLAAEANPALRLVIERARPEQTYCLTIGTASWDGEAWPATRVTVLGDAVHAMPPNRGSGANTALQDARRLAAALVEVHHGRRELLPAIAEYERRMRRDGFEAVAASVDGLGDFLSRN